MVCLALSNTKVENFFSDVLFGGLREAFHDEHRRSIGADHFNKKQGESAYGFP